MGCDIHAQFKDLFGEDHSRTLAAANNLAIDYRLVGDPGAARDLDQDTLDRRRTMVGPWHPYAQTAKENLPRGLLEAGATHHWGCYGMSLVSPVAICRW